MTILEDVSLRPLDERDLERVLHWRNADRIRLAMYNDHIIDWEEHSEWYRRTSADPRCECLISEYRKHPVGFVSFTEMNKKDGTCFWAFYVGEPNAAKGCGSAMEIHAIDRMVNYHKMRKISCEVLKTQSYVIALHKKFGFEEEGVFRRHVRKDDSFVDVVRLALFSEDWPRFRTIGTKRLSEAVS